MGARREGYRETGVHRKGLVEWKAVTDILLDTGCSRTVVRRELVPQSNIREGDVTTIRCAHGDTVLYPLAEVELEVEGKRIVVEAAVSETLPMSVLLGTDMAELRDLLGNHRKDEALAVVTRVRAKHQQEKETICQHKEARGIWSETKSCGARPGSGRSKR